MTRWRVFPGLVLAFGLSGCARTDSADRWSEVLRLDAEGRDLYQAATLREALPGLPAALAATGADPVAFVGFDFPRALTDELTAEATRVWSRATNGEQRLVVVQYRPVPRRPAFGKWWGAFRGVLLPDAVDGKTCVVLIPDDAHVFAAGQPRLNRESIGSLVSPCAHAARFGPPGPAMRQWLDATGHAGSRSLEWLLLPSAAVAGIWWQSQSFGSEPDDLIDRWLPLAALASGAEQRTPPYWLGLDAVGCLAGRVAQCVTLVTDSSGVRRRGSATWRIDGVVVHRRDGMWAGPIEPSRWTSELIRQGGEDRFRALWAVEGRFESAFGAIYRQPLGESVEGWARHEWEGRGGFRPVRLGPAADLLAVLSAIGWSGLFLLVAMVASRRVSPRG